MNPSGLTMAGMVGITFIAWGLLGYGFSALAYPYFERFLTDVRSVKKNYRGIEIPYGTGLLLYFTLIVGICLQWLVYARFLEPLLVAWMLFGATTAAFIGWLDDVYGDDREKGLKAHFRQFWQERRMTTGGLKAFSLSLMGGLVAIATSEGIPDTLINTAVLILAINTVNLFDLRPGRAIKFFLLMLFLLLPFSRLGTEGTLLLPFIGSLLHLYRHDIAAHSMLGDSGANLMGFLLGFGIVMTQPQWVKVLLVIFYLALHWFAEHHSISNVIRQNQMLKWLDNLGRDSEPDKLI